MSGYELELRLPIRTVSEANKREHWTKSHRRKQAQRREIWAELSGKRKPKLPCDVWLTRIAPRALDEGDNLPMTFKTIRDQIAEWIGVDDRTDKITWRYNQRKGEVREYAVIIRIYSDL